MPTEDERNSAGPETAEVDDLGKERGEAAAGSPDLALLVERLADEVTGLRAEFAAKTRYDDVKERQIAGMHDELERFRAGLHLRLLQPLFNDLIAMHDDLLDASSQDDASGELESFRGSVLESLSRNGVSSYSVDSDEIDTRRQRVIRAVATEDETLDRHVQRRVRVGFEHDNGKVLRPEWVVAYRYQRNADEIAASRQPEGNESGKPHGIRY